MVISGNVGKMVIMIISVKAEKKTVLMVIQVKTAISGNVSLSLSLTFSTVYWTRNICSTEVERNIYPELTRNETNSEADRALVLKSPVFRLKESNHTLCRDTILHNLDHQSS
jgi:hypothetical protein